jgi:hypothetical protein
MSKDFFSQFNAYSYHDDAKHQDDPRNGEGDVLGGRRGKEEDGEKGIILIEFEGITTV